MRRRLALGLLLLVTVGAGCDGGDDEEIQTSLAIPRPGDAAYGAFGHVLGSDRGQSNDAQLDQLWIGFGRRESWEAYLSVRDRLAPEGVRPWICGRVVADANEPLGFYFDPMTTTAAEVTAETFQISLDGLKSSPEGAEDGLPRWCVTFFPEQVVPGEAP